VLISVGGPVDGFDELYGAIADHSGDDLDDPSLGTTMLYSSGTTGRPKAVAHTHAAPAASFAGLAQGVLGVTADDRIYSVAKLFSPSGLGNSMFFPFFAGGSAVLVPEQPGGDVVAATVTAERPTLLFARPANYRQILDAVPAGALASLRLAVCSGDRLPADLRAAFRERYAVDIVEGTGSTEALHIYLCNRPGRIRAGSSGELVPGYDARIVGDDGRAVPDGEIGDLHIRGGSTLLCYWRNRVKTRETLLGDWVVTGDKYSRDADGYYWYAGRSDDMWFADGQWVSPVDVEDVLAADPAVRDAAVTRVPGAQPYVLACVVLDDAGEQTGDDAGGDPVERLGGLVADKLGPGRRPDRIAVVPALPRTASGKVQRHRLVELVDDGGPR
jgi:benzoate-CoA ligase